MPPREFTMTPEERFRFDLQGYIVIKSVISRAECNELIALSDEIWPRQPNDGPYRRTGNITQWDQ